MFAKTFLMLSILFFVGCVDKNYYRPDSKVYQTPAKQGLKYEDVRFKSKDGTELNAWFIPSTKPAKGTVVHFHGNAQNMSAHYSFVSWLPKNHFNVFVFDYRGYGKSKGKPSRQGVHEDSVAALKYISERKDIDPNKIIVFGQSLGGANAIAACAEFKHAGIKGIVIDSAFASYRKIARDVVKQTSLASVSAPLTKTMVKEDHSPIQVIDQISPTPILFIHGTHDQVVPYAHALELYNKAKDPKQIWTIKGGRHTDALIKYGNQVLPRLYKLMIAWVDSKEKPSK